jgi:ABC-2 type transporter
MYLRLFAHVLVGFLIGALYYDIGNDGAKVLSNLGFLFFNMLFLMYTSMTITILSCELEFVVMLVKCFDSHICFSTFSPARDASPAQRKLQPMVLFKKLLLGHYHL